MWFNILKRKAEVIYTEDTLKEAGVASAFVGGKRTLIVGEPIYGGKKRGKKRKEEY